MIFRLLPSGKADEFTKSLAQDIARRYPPVIANDPEQTVSQQRIDEILALALSPVTGLGAVGFFRKTRLGISFRWELKEMGYEDEFVQTAGRDLTNRLRRSSR